VTHSHLNFALFRLLDEISAFLQPQIRTGFLKSLYSKEDRISKIEEYHRRISGLVASFQVYSLVHLNSWREILKIKSQISAVLDIQAWQSKNDDARIADQRVLHNRFDALEANQNKLMKALGTSYVQYLSRIPVHVTMLY
jgi:hypothetical protein